MKIKPKNPKKKWGKAAPTEKEKKGSVERVNRTVYLTVAVLLIVLAVAVAATSAANRAKQNAPAPNTTGTEITRAPLPTTPPTTAAPKPNDTKPPVTDSNAGVTGGDAVDVVEPIPTFALPTDDGVLGNRHDPTVQVFSSTLNEWRVHLGVDILTAAAAPVYAAADGIITKIEEDPLMGMSITIGHAAEAVSVYKNLDQTLPEGIKVGSKIKAGELIGCVGDGAVLELADEPHLHFEILVANEVVDPLEYMSQSALSVLTSGEDKTYED